MATPEAFWRSAFLEAPFPLVALDWRGVLAVWNEAFAELFRELAGQEPEAFQGSFYELLREREGIRLDYFAAELFLGARRRAQIETPFRDSEGRLRWLSASLGVVEPGGAGAANASRFLLCRLEETTERVARERSLSAAKEEAERATETKSLFLANMSHEIRTPIQTILGVVELLGETRLDGEQSDYASQIGFSADVLLALINDILDFSKIEAGKLSLEAADFELASLVGQSVDLLALDAHRKGLELVAELGEGVPGLLRGDQARLRQILINLLKNAIKFTDRGLVGLFVTRVGGAPGAGDCLRFEVRDSGIGVPEALRQRLFTPFYQADLPAERRASGTGLGLAISRRLVELMEGRIGVLPNEPRGSIFWFEIPLLRPEFAEEAPLPLLDLEAKRLLVVDDEETARGIAMRAAARGGWEVQGSASGEAALAELSRAAAEGHPYEFCLVDQNMPGMDGWRLASEIRGRAELVDLRLVLMVPTGSMGRDAKMKLLRWFSAYLPKPLRPGVLLEALETARLAGGGEAGEEGELEELPAEEAGAPAAAAAPGGGRAEPFSGEVLVAEDHEVNRELFALILGKLGLRVDEARDGREAVEKALSRLGEGRPHDLILMDIFMPRLDGYGAAREIRAGGWEGPLVAVTALALKGEREKCLEAGMNDVLLKPFRKADLEALLRLWLPRAQGGGAAARQGPRRAPEGGARLGPGPTEPPAEAAAPRPVLDWEASLETFLGREETVRGLLLRFEAKAREQLAELSAALERRDFGAFRELAHSIKGAAWNLSALALGDAAREAETAGKQGDDQGAVMALTALGGALEAFSEALSAKGLRSAPYQSGAEKL